MVDLVVVADDGESPLVIAIVFNKTKSKDFSVWLPLMLKVMFHKII